MKATRIRPAGRSRPARVVVAVGMALFLAGRGSAAAGEPVELPPPRVRAWQIGLLRPDRLRHASLALSGGLSVGLLARRPAAAAGSALALGFLKELWDARAGAFDGTDLLADAVGAGLAAAITARLNP